MTNKGNPHIGSTFESWLDEEGAREEVAAAVIKQIIAEQLAAEIKRKGIAKAPMAEMANTSRFGVQPRAL
jgi:antitoxin HicB